VLVVIEVIIVIIAETRLMQDRIRVFSRKEAAGGRGV